MFAAARSQDPTICDLHKPGPVPVSAGMIAPRMSPNLVRIGRMPAARQGDRVICLGGEEAILKGEPSVRIEGMPAARVTDPVAQKLLPTGRILLGCPTVRIGTSTLAIALKQAAAEGAPYGPEVPVTAPRGAK